MSLSITHLSGLLATAAGPHLYWLASRAAGSAALILTSVSVCVGLLMGGRVLKRRWPDLRVTHEALSLATLAALAVHGLTLLGDGFLHLSLADIGVPFLGGYKTVWTTSGIVAFWAMLALALSYYARARIGVQRWRMLHRFTALAWILGIVHSLGEGTDAGQAWFLAMTAIVVLPALVLLLARWLGSASSPQSQAPSQSAAPANAVAARSGSSQAESSRLPTGGPRLPGNEPLRPTRSGHGTQRRIPTPTSRL